MKQHLRNAAYGMLDYAAYPIGMLALAPILVRSLGATRFGIWAFSMAVLNTGAILASGFGDANIQQIASSRGSGDDGRVEMCVRTTLSTHLLLGTLLACAGFIGAPFMARRVAPNDVMMCTTTLQIAAGCILLRALETVVVSTQRAFERYGEAVSLSVSARVLSLVAAAILALHGESVIWILTASGVLLIVGTVAQFVRLTRFLPWSSLIPGFNRSNSRALLRLGSFTWLQSAGAAVFSQVDRVIVGVAFGAVTVGAYSICMQIAQPIAGSAASALHFIFPVLARTSSAGGPRLEKSIALAFLCNVVFVILTSTLMLLCGEHLIRVWTTPAVAAAGAVMLPWAVAGAACVGLATTGVYSMLALGRAGAVVCTTVCSGAAMLVALGVLSHRYGILGIAVSRVVFGVVSLSVYIPLVETIRRQQSITELTPDLNSVREGA
jgi:O-antigen/teichoic acid export membrane protein